MEPPGPEGRGGGAMAKRQPITINMLAEAARDTNSFREGIREINPAQVNKHNHPRPAAQATGTMAELAGDDLQGEESSLIFASSIFVCSGISCSLLLFII